jgi:aspartyl-tRNA(Asn)/glutamyl-tRNA(Gln) amidotransferase subunit A
MLSLNSSVAADALANPRRPQPVTTGALNFLSLQDAAALIRTRRISPVELTQSCLVRIEALNPSLNAFVTLMAESALAQARVAETEILRGRWRGPLHGIPVGLKDLFDTAGVRTTGASALFMNRVPTQDAAVVLRLKDAGAVLLGKQNMQEFAYGGTTIPTAFGRVSNPWDLERIAGGSSGGPAAAVAAGLCFAALGSDTGGSIRQPAALCGTVGLMPTYGRVSNRGVIPLSWSLDHVGPITRCVVDAAMVLQVIAGYDPGDISTQDRPVADFSIVPDKTPRKLRIGLPRAFFYADLDPEVRAALDRALSVLVGLGAETRDVALDVSTDRTVIRAEAYSYHAQHIARNPELYIPETLTKLRLGSDIDATSYIRARRDLEQLRRTVPGVFADVELLVTPTVPIPAPKASDYPSSLEGVLALEGTILRNTRPFNMYALPTISIPCGFTQSGLPIGMQISGPPWEERRVLALALAYQEATQWHRRKPALAGV